MKQGEIWFTALPFGVGHEYRKKRPVLIIQCDETIEKSSVVTVIPFTSNTCNVLDQDILVLKSKKNCLYKDSVLKMQHIYSFDKQRFEKKIGELACDVMSEVKEFLRGHLGV